MAPELMAGVSLKLMVLFVIWAIPLESAITPPVAAPETLFVNKQLFMLKVSVRTRKPPPYCMVAFSI